MTLVTDRDLGADTHVGDTSLSNTRPFFTFFGHGTIGTSSNLFEAARAAGFEVKQPTCTSDLADLLGQRSGGRLMLEITDVSTATNALTRNEYGMLDEVLRVDQQDRIPVCLITRTPELLLQVNYLRSQPRRWLISKIIVQLPDDMELTALFRQELQEIFPRVSNGHLLCVPTFEDPRVMGAITQPSH